MMKLVCFRVSSHWLWMIYITYCIKILYNFIKQNCYYQYGESETFWFESGSYIKFVFNNFKLNTRSEVNISWPLWFFWMGEIWFCFRGKHCPKGFSKNCFLFTILAYNNHVRYQILCSLYSLNAVFLSITDIS